MLSKRKFIELYMVNGLFIWLAVFVSFVAFFATHIHVVPIVLTGGIGLFLLVISKWRLWKEGHFKTFGYGKMTKFERAFYVAGHLFIALAIYLGLTIYFAGTQQL